MVEHMIPVGPKVMRALAKAAAQFEERQPKAERAVELVNMAAKHPRGKLMIKVMRDVKLNLDLPHVDHCVANNWLVLECAKGNGGDPKVQQRWVYKITKAGREMLEAHRRTAL